MSTSDKQKKALARAFGRELRRLRKEAGLTQAELAEKAGVHKMYVSQMERELKVPSIGIAFSLSDALDTEVGPFLERVKLLSKEDRE